MIILIVHPRITILLNLLILLRDRKSNIKYESNSGAYLIYCPNFNIFTPFSRPSNALQPSSLLAPHAHFTTTTTILYVLQIICRVVLMLHSLYLYQHVDDGRREDGGGKRGGKLELKRAIQELSKRKTRTSFDSFTQWYFVQQRVGTLQICHVRAEDVS